jgi:hypothetical protein
MIALIRAESYTDSDFGVDYGGPISLGGKIFADASDCNIDPSSPSASPSAGLTDSLSFYDG